MGVQEETGIRALAEYTHTLQCHVVYRNVEWTIKPLIVRCIDNGVFMCMCVVCKLYLVRACVCAHVQHIDLVSHQLPDCPIPSPPSPLPCAPTSPSPSPLLPRLTSLLLSSYLTSPLFCKISPRAPRPSCSLGSNWFIFRFPIFTSGCRYELKKL